MAKAKKEVGYDSTFPTNLRNILKEKGMTQEQLADKIGVKRQAVGKWCSGDTVPDIVSLERMSQVLNRSTDWLLGRSTFKNKETEYIKASDLGLSEKAIEVLQQIVEGDTIVKEERRIMPMVNYLIEQEEVSLADDERWDEFHTPIISVIIKYLTIIGRDNVEIQVSPDGKITEREYKGVFRGYDLDAVQGIFESEIVDRTLLDRIDATLKKLKQQKRREDAQHGAHSQD